MNIRDTLPKQSEIEEFLGRDFFPKYPLPLPLKEAVDMVQVEFDITDEARALPAPRAHASTFEGGTILECLTYFAILRLQERRFIVRTGKNMFLRAEGRKYYSTNLPRKDVNHCVYRLREMAKVNFPLTQGMDILRRCWPEEIVLAAADKVCEG